MDNPAPAGEEVVKPTDAELTLVGKLMGLDLSGDVWERKNVDRVVGLIRQYISQLLPTVRIAAADMSAAALESGAYSEVFHPIGCICPDCRPASPPPSVRPAERRVIDGKFHIEGNEIIKTSSGEVVPEWEPLALMRARDHLMLRTLAYYRELCVEDYCTDYHLKLVDELIGKFARFAREHPEWMKQPGITRGAAFRPTPAAPKSSTLGEEKNEHET